MPAPVDAPAMLGRRQGLGRILAGCGIVAAAGCGPTLDRAIKPGADREIQVVSHGWHTEIALATSDAPSDLAHLVALFPSAGWLAFGFGERDFFMAPEETLAGMLAALLPSPSVVLATPLPRTPIQVYSSHRAVSLFITRVDLYRLGVFLQQTLDTHAGVPEELGPGPSPGSRFYAAATSYHAFFNCNTWTAAALQHAGLPVHPGGVLFASQVMDQARQAATRQAGPA